jgi:hypothetical protein
VFEPIPLNAQLIRTNAELNDFTNITVNNVALAGEKGSNSDPAVCALFAFENELVNHQNIFKCENECFYEFMHACKCVNVSVCMYV